MTAAVALWVGADVVMGTAVGADVLRALLFLDPVLLPVCKRNQEFFLIFCKKKKLCLIFVYSFMFIIFIG